MFVVSLPVVCRDSLMLVFLLSVHLFLTPVDATARENPCRDLHREAYAKKPVPAVSSPEQFQWYLNKTRAAKACYREQVPHMRGHRAAYVDEVWALAHMDRREEAMAVVRSFFERFDPSKDGYMFGLMHQWRGGLLRSDNNYTDALPELFRALDYRSDWRQPEDFISLHLDIGSMLQSMRDFDEAKRYFQRADSMAQSLAEMTPELLFVRARSLRYQSDLLIEKTDFLGIPDTSAYEKAARLAEASLAFSTPARHDQEAAHAFILMSEAVSFLGDTEAAQRHLDQADRLVQRMTEGFLHYHLRRKQGRLSMQLRAYEASQEAFEEALELARNVPNLTEDPERRAFRDLGHLAEVQKDYERAAAYYTEAIRATEVLRQSLRSTSWSAQAFADWQESHRSLVRVLLAQGKFEDAFEALEQTRARHLLDLRTQSRLRTEVSPGDQARFDSLTAALVEIRNQLATDTLSSAQRTELLLSEQQVVPERQAVLDLGESLDIPSLEEVQQALAQRSQVIVSYFIDEKNISDRLFGRTPLPHAFVLTPDTLIAVPLPISGEALHALFAEVSPLLPKTDALPDFNDRLFSLAALKQLYNALYAPVAPYIEPNDRLVFIPDGPLFKLPFGMLAESEMETFQYQDAPFLVKKHPISVELASILLIQPSSVGQKSSFDVLAMGRKDFSADRSASPLRTSASLLIDLPAVQDEMASISQQFNNVHALLDTEATEASFFDLSPGARVLHLASHTVINASAPLQNAILLSKDPNDDRYDGTLYLHEIERQNLAADLVVLSGCSTARGVLHRGEGLAGLQYAFRAMGAESSLATLWFVEDQATVQLMDAFYRHLQQGQPKDVALQRAQLDYLARVDVDKSPFYWAAPVLYGNTQPLMIAKRRPVWLLWTALGFLLLLAFLALRFGRRKRPSTP